MGLKALARLRLAQAKARLAREALQNIEKAKAEEQKRLQAEEQARALAAERARLEAEEAQKRAEERARIESSVTVDPKTGEKLWRYRDPADGWWLEMGGALPDFVRICTCVPSPGQFD